MKKYLLLSILFLFSISSINSQVYKYIPDADFRAFLVSEGYPFDVSGDSLDISSPFVTSATYMSCGSLTISSIEGIQYFTNLIYLDCSSCNITSISTLPVNLEQFEAFGNAFSSLPSSFPNKIRIISLGFTTLTSLPILPDSLRYIGLQYNMNLTSLPTLPPFLNELNCPDNYNLSSLPALPNRLTLLDCSNSAITCLPYLPNSLTSIAFDGTSVTCIPNLVALATYSPPIGTFPFCNPLINTCPSYIAISGTTYTDDDADCSLDSLEHRIPNVSLVLQNNATITQRLSTNLNGVFGFDAIPADTYTVHVDTLESPFTLSCISSGYDTIILDSFSLYFTDRNFAMHCKPGFDIGTTGLLSTGLIRPATPAAFDLHAGDMSTIYGIHCTSIAGKISIDFSGPMYYTGVSLGTLVPDTILPNRLVWNIANFSTLDFNNAIKPKFFVDSTAVAGSLVCFTTNITPSIGDRIPTNNSISQCFTVRASYDPNIKEVFPSGTVTATQDWLYYTIHFQNTGTSFAENIYVWDTIDPNLNLNTIQVMGASHDQFMNVFNNNRSVRFNFLNINLIDSATNEPASHGWVQYRIKPNTSLAEGVQIHNNASIYFDLNAPVVTNTTSTKICNTPSTINLNRTIVSGQTITIGAHTYNRAGLFTDILTNSRGCDSTIYTSITVVSCPTTINTSQNFTIYNGDSVVVRTHIYRTTGTYIDTIKAINGVCDSIIITTNLTVISCPTTINTNQNFTIYDGDSIIVRTHIYRTTGTYKDTIKAINGVCDSIIITTNLTVISCPTIINTTQNFTIYNGDSVVVRTHVYRVTGTYKDTVKTDNGYCDSIIITTNLTVITCPTIINTTQNFTIYNGDSVVVRTHVYRVSGTFKDTVKTDNGYCDSIIITTNLTVIICPTITNTTQNFTIYNGDSIIVFNNTYYTSGTYKDTIKTANGYCDSIIITTNLSVISCAPTDTIVQNISINLGQQITIGTNTYDSNGIYRDTFVDVTGNCDSLVIITYLHVITGINSTDLEVFSMYPNPANQSVMIQLEGNPTEPISILDMYGRNVFTTEIILNKYTINTENWSNGTYVVQLGSRRAKLVVGH